MIAGLPWSEPNSGPAVVYTFSSLFVFMNAFCTLAPNISRSFSAAKDYYTHTFSSNNTNKWTLREDQLNVQQRQNEPFEPG